VVLIAHIALGVIVAVAQAAEPRTLTLACKGTKNETTPRIVDEDQSSISVDIIMDFGGRTVTGFPLRVRLGMMSRNSSSRFALISGAKNASPVMLPAWMA
jgi:hypothetical protein